MFYKYEIYLQLNLSNSLSNLRKLTTKKLNVIITMQTAIKCDIMEQKFSSDHTEFYTKY